MMYVQQRYPVDITTALDVVTRKAKKMLKLDEDDNDKTEVYLFARVDDGKFYMKSEKCSWWSQARLGLAWLGLAKTQADFFIAWSVWAENSAGLVCLVFRILRLDQAWFLKLLGLKSSSPKSLGSAQLCSGWVFACSFHH
jgi:hypothetical protein